MAGIIDEDLELRLPEGIYNKLVEVCRFFMSLQNIGRISKYATMTTQTFEFNLSVTEVFFLDVHRTIFAGYLDGWVDDDFDLRKIFPCHANLILDLENIESFSLNYEYFSQKKDDPEMKFFVAFKKLNTSKDMIEQSIADKKCMIKLTMACEDQ